MLHAFSLYELKKFFKNYLFLRNLKEKKTFFNIKNVQLRLNPFKGKHSRERERNNKLKLKPNTLFFVEEHTFV